MEKINQKELSKMFNQIKLGDKQIFNEFYKKYYNLVYGISFSVTRNKENSEDIAQIVFEKIFKISKEKLPNEHQASWLYTVTKNEALQFIRKQKLDVEIDEIYEIGENESNIDSMLDVDYYNYLIKGLNKKEQEIVTLKVISNCTFSQISKLLNMPIGTVQWNYYKSINVLKVSLSTITAMILTFIIALSQIVEKDNKINGISENVEFKSKENEKTDSSKTNLEFYNNELNEISIDENNLIENKTIQEVQVNYCKEPKEHEKPYILFCIPIIVLIVWCILVSRIKNKFYKKSKKSNKIVS